MLIKQWFAESFSALALEVQLDNILLLLNMDTLFQAISVAPEILVENLSLLNKAELSTLKN
ncbi:MAG: hypothetical protein HWD59_03670 [Coxiellaceae bacterium]|nr:MAG: hypothetical protein HWD59_03670 [Coxiellaceae bacterium]